MLATAGCGFGCGLMICVSCELCDGGLLFGIVGILWRQDPRIISLFWTLKDELSVELSS
jgi:hypothetical protein